MSDVNRIGLTQLSHGEDAGGGPYRLNVIFVHGPRGHPKHTWEGGQVYTKETAATPRKRDVLRSLLRRRPSAPIISAKATRGGSDSIKPFWPAEYLTHDIPEARVWTYGYNADAVDGLFDRNSENSVEQHGRDLAAHVDGEIKNKDPILFVAHSLGGIIVKEAVRSSSKTWLSRTKVVVFFGTPHRGSSHAGWGDIAANLAQLAVRDSNKKIIDTLHVDSSLLNGIHQDFTTLALIFGIKIHSFQEAQGISGMKGPHNKVVDDFSSGLGLPRTLETAESIDADHMQMTQCSKRSDAHYQTLLDVFRRFTCSKALEGDRSRPWKVLESIPRIAREGDRPPAERPTEPSTRLPAQLSVRPFLANTTSAGFSPIRPVAESGPRRPVTRRDFGVAIICALSHEADAVEALFDHCWDKDGPPYDKAEGDPNAYVTGAIGRHNVVLAPMPGMGKVNAAAAATSIRASFSNIKLAVLVGICGVTPFTRSSGDEIVLGDVVVSDGIVQYDLGRQLPESFVRKDTLLDSLARPNVEIRSLLAKLRGVQGREELGSKMAGYMDILRSKPKLCAEYPGVVYDRLFEATYRHRRDGASCIECGCEGKLVPRRRLEQGSPQPAVHFGLMGSGDTVMKSGEKRDAIAQREGILAFEMEGAGIWDTFPCVVIKGACDYADSHKSDRWQLYAAATAAACMKAFLEYWAPSLPERCTSANQRSGLWFLVPYPENESFIGRKDILEKLQQQPHDTTSQLRIALFGLGGIGKTQIALRYAYWVRQTYPDMSVFWIHASNAQRFRQAYTSIAQECQIPGHDDPKTDVLELVKTWLERKDSGRWLMIIDNADDARLFFGQPGEVRGAGVPSRESNLGRYVPECAHGSILITTKNKQAGSRLSKGKLAIEVGKMDTDDSNQLLRGKLEEGDLLASDELSALASRLVHIPLALVQAAAFIEENTMAVSDYLALLDGSDQDLVELLRQDFETVGRDPETPRAVTETWMLSFEQIQQQDPFAGELLSLMSMFDRQAIPLAFLTYYSEKRHRQEQQQQQQQQHGEIRLQRALGVLKAFCFVTTGNDQSLDMHRLVQLVTQRWLAKKNTSREFAGQALEAVARTYPLGGSMFDKRTMCSKYLPHANAVLEREGTGSDNEKLAKADLLAGIGDFFDYLGASQDSERLLRESIALKLQVQELKYDHMRATLSSLALAYRSQGRLEEAEPLQLQVLEIYKRLYGPEHPDTLVAMVNIGNTLQKQGRLKEAEPLQLQVLEIYKRLYGPEHISTLGAMINIGNTLQKQGRLKEAEPLQLQVLEIYKRLYGPEHISTLGAMINIGNTLQKQGRLKEAESLYLKVTEATKKVLGEEHPYTLSNMYNLAVTWFKQGRFEDAITLMQKCVHLCQRVLGPDHPDTRDSLHSLNYWTGQQHSASSSMDS